MLGCAGPTAPFSNKRIASGLTPDTMQLLTEVTCKLEPLLLDRHGRCRGLTFCAQIPVGGVLVVALLAVEVGMDPCTVMVRQILDEVMRLMPAPGAGEPQCAKDFGQLGRWLGGLASGLIELFRIHFGRMA